MNQKVLQWANLDAKVWPGAFREKDLQLLFNECVQKYEKLSQLTRQKQELLQKHSPKQSQNLDGQNSRDNHRLNQDQTKKKQSQNKYKCQIRSCGKVMNSQSALAIHSKKHYDRKGRKIDIVDASQEFYQEQ